MRAAQLAADCLLSAHAGGQGVDFVQEALALEEAGPGGPADGTPLPAILRDVFNPFRLARVDPAWLAWNDGTVVRLALSIYDERAFTQERMGVLADALEDASCSDADLLRHLREPGPHAKGCWAVELLLEKG